MQNLPPNTFYDINKFPKEFGILVFPISLVRVVNNTGQDPNQCLEYIKHFSPSKISEPKLGLNMIYGDYLYLHSTEQAAVLKQKFTNLVLNHKNAFQNLIVKEHERFQIQHAFSYEVWNQLYLDYQGDFDSELRRFKKEYMENIVFVDYLKQDAEYCNRELNQEQINFFLEEHFMLYLISKGKIILPNQYVQGREKWILWCYPGKPLKAQVYVYQKNPLKLDLPENEYQNCGYDLEAKKLIDFMRIDLETYNYKYDN